MKSKYLVIIQKETDINILKQENINKFLYPLKSFSIGFNNYFNLNEIEEENSYLLINKILDTFEIDELESLFKNLPNNIKGIVFDDLGIIEIIKNLNLEKILYQSHFCTNSKSIIEYLKYVDSCVISSDITLNEVNNILKECTKPLSIYGFGYLPVSYSKRLLNTNFCENYNLDKTSKLILKNTNYEFISIESDSGTYFYENKIFNGLNEKYHDNLIYVIINLLDITVSDFLNNKSNYTGFLHKETIYKLKEGN